MDDDVDEQFECTSEFDQRYFPLATLPQQLLSNIKEKEAQRAMEEEFARKEKERMVSERDNGMMKVYVQTMKQFKTDEHAPKEIPPLVQENLDIITASYDKSFDYYSLYRQITNEDNYELYTPYPEFWNKLSYYTLREYTDNPENVSIKVLDSVYFLLYDNVIPYIFEEKHPILLVQEFIKHLWAEVKMIEELPHVFQEPFDPTVNYMKQYNRFSKGSLDNMSIHMKTEEEELFLNFYFYSKGVIESSQNTKGKQEDPFGVNIVDQESFEKAFLLYKASSQDTVSEHGVLSDEQIRELVSQPFSTEQCYYHMALHVDTTLKNDISDWAWEMDGEIQEIIQRHCYHRIRAKFDLNDPEREYVVEGKLYRVYEDGSPCKLKLVSEEDVDAAVNQFQLVSKSIKESRGNILEITEFMQIVLDTAELPYNSCIDYEDIWIKLKRDESKKVISDVRLRGFYNQYFYYKLRQFWVYMDPVKDIEFNGKSIKVYTKDGFMSVKDVERDFKLAEAYYLATFGNNLVSSNGDDGLWIHVEEDVAVGEVHDEDFQVPEFLPSI